MFYEYEHFGTSEYLKIERNENFSFPVHLHNSFEFITVTTGTMKVTVDDNTYILNQGESVLVFPNQLHSLSSTKSTHMLCIFSTDLVKAYYSKLSKKIPADNFFKPEAFIMQLINLLSSDSSLVDKKGVLYSLCSQFDKNAKYNDRNKVYDGL